MNRSDRGTVGNRLSKGERQLLDHWTRWGSTMYPVRKVKGGWVLEEMFGVELPGVDRTKREATERFERFIEVLLAAAGQEAYEKAVAANAATGSGGPAELAWREHDDLDTAREELIQGRKLSGPPIEEIKLVPCECEHAQHFDHESDVTVLNGPEHDYGMRMTEPELREVLTPWGTFRCCASCREEHLSEGGLVVTATWSERIRVVCRGCGAFLAYASEDEAIEAIRIAWECHPPTNLHCRQCGDRLVRVPDGEGLPRLLSVDPFRPSFCPDGGYHTEGTT